MDALGGDIGAGTGNTEDLEMEYFKPDAEAVASKPEDEADALLRGDFGAGNGNGNRKMGDEGAHTLEVFVGERDQGPCNGNEAGAATLKVPGGVVFPDSSSHEVKPDEAHAISVVLVGASEAGMDALGGDMGAGNGNTEDLKVENFKPDAEAATGTPADEADIDALLPGDFGAGNGKMDEEGAHTLEVTAVEMDQDPCNGNEAGAATRKVPGGVVSSIVKDDVGMETLGAQGASPSLRADMSSVDTISDPESHKGRLFCNKQEEQIESEVTTLKKAEDELLRIKEELDCKQNQLLKREQDQRLKEEEWKLLQCKEEKALKEIEARTLRQIQLVQQMEVTVSRKVEELAQTEEKLDRKYKQLNKNEDDHRLKEKEWKMVQCKEDQALKEKGIELFERGNELSLRQKKLLQFEKDLNTAANDLAVEDRELKRMQEKLNKKLSETLQFQSNLAQKETELNNREKELGVNNHKVQTTYYAAKLGRAIGMKNLRTLIGRDEGSDLILPLVEPKDEEDWNRRHILYDAIFMMFLPFVFCLQGVFASMPNPPSDLVQTIIFYVCGAIWMLACLGGLLGIFSKWPGVHVASTLMGRILFLAFCIMQVGALWFLAPPSKGSKIAAGILCGCVIVTHIGCWVQDLIENRKS
ncbi:hypothetical protein ACQ4PT_023533 [Festuca glaucescens]